jgi:lipoic acid synthetase
VAEAAVRLGLRYTVITSVTRDDLPDGGAAAFAAVVRAVRTRLPQAGVEVLTPDFRGNRDCVLTVLDSEPTVYNHNVETSRRLTAEIRSGADYDRSLSLLRTVAEQDAGVWVKSGFMLGLGETEAEIHELLRDLRESGVQVLTIGQYLAPSREHWPVERFVPPEEFDHWKNIAREQYGYEAVASGPLVRSSYLAEEVAKTLVGRKTE